MPRAFKRPAKNLVVVVVVVAANPNYLRQASPDRGKYICTHTKGPVDQGTLIVAHYRICTHRAASGEAEAEPEAQGPRGDCGVRERALCVCGAREIGRLFVARARARERREPLGRAQCVVR